MSSRLELHEKLKEIINNNNVYFQPPTNKNISYPCVIYSLGDIKTRYADNKVYSAIKAYDVTFISKNPDNDYAMQVFLKFELCRFDRRFVSDNLYHDVFTIHY